MGFRFQRRIKIAPGIRPNVSKSGLSLTTGLRGASVNVGKKGIYSNLGIPGTGLSRRDRLDAPLRGKKSCSPSPPNNEQAGGDPVPTAIEGKRSGTAALALVSIVIGFFVAAVF